MRSRFLEIPFCCCLLVAACASCTRYPGNTIYVDRSIVAPIEQATRIGTAMHRGIRVEFTPPEELYLDKQTFALAKAAAEARVDEIDRLVAAGADVNRAGALNVTPLYLGLDDFRGFQRLLEHGADPNIKFDDGDSVLQIVTQSKPASYLEAALFHGADPNFATSRVHTYHGTLIHLVAHSVPDALSKAELLVDAGANMDALLDDTGLTGLTAAIRFGAIDVAELLLLRGADFRIRDAKGRTALTHLLSDPERYRGINEPLFHKLVAWLEERNAPL